MAQIIPAKLMRAGAMTGYVSIDGELANAQFVVATQELLAAAMPGADEGDKVTREVQVGDFIAIHGAGEDTKRVHVPFVDLFGENAEVADNFTIQKPGTDEQMRFLGRHMLKARESLFVATAGAEADPAHRRLLGALQGSFERVLQNLDDFPNEAAKQALMAASIDAMGGARLPVEPEAFLRKVRAEGLRMQIAEIQPEHPDALRRDPVGVDALLADAGLGGGALRGAAVRGPAGVMLREADMLRMVSANDRLCREVFGAVTTTDIANLSVRLLTPAEHTRLVEHFEESEATLNGEWVDEVRRRMSAITSGAMPGYRFQAVVASQAGRDVLLVTDSVSDGLNTPEGRGVAYLYSWPTADRQPLIEVNRGHVTTFGEDDVPSEDEVRRLEGVLEAMAGNEFDFDEDDDDELELGALPEPRMVH